MKTRWTILPIAAAILVPAVWHRLGGTRTVTVHRAAAFDVSPPLGSLGLLGERETADTRSGCGEPDHACDNGRGTSPQGGLRADAPVAPAPPVNPAGAAVEQT